jgi:arsenate reductase-like glutaredoxin family protein
MAQNGFVIGINTSENRTTLNGLTMTSPMKPNATNNYSSIYGVLRDDGFNVIRSYYPDVWMSINNFKSYIELVGNYGLRLIDDNNYFFKPPVSNPLNISPLWLINPIFYNQSYNVYNMTNINSTKAIYNYDALYSQVYSILPYKNTIYGHKLCEEPNYFHWYPHAGVFPSNWHDPSLGPSVLNQWYSMCEVPPQNLSDAFGHFQQQATLLGHKLINDIARHGSSHTQPDGSGQYSYDQYLNLTNKGDVFFEGSYFHWHWIEWLQSTIPIDNGQDYLGKFKSIDYAKTKYNSVFSEMYLSYDIDQYDIRDYSWYTNRNNPNGNLLYFMSYTSIIHGATGVFFYGGGDSYDSEDAADIQRKTLLNDNTATNNNFVIANMSNIYQTVVSNLSQELRYLKELDILSDDPTSILYTKTNGSDVNGILPSSMTYLPATISAANAQDILSYTNNGQTPYSSSTSFTNYHRGEDYGLRYTIRTNGDKAIMIISNPNPYSITSNVSLNFNSITNPIIAKSTGVSVLFETPQTVTSSNYKLDRNWIDRQLFIDNVISTTQDLDVIKCNMKQYSIPFTSTSNKTIGLTFGPFDVKVLKFVGENITTNTTWNTDKSIEKDVIVEAGNTLTVSSTIKLMPNVKIIVRKGGKLIIDGGTLTSSCDNLWQGILVQGDQSYDQSDETKQGVLEMKNGATIKNAEVAVYVGEYFVNNGNGALLNNHGGGIIKIDGAQFLNNQKDIVMKPYGLWSTVTHKPIPQKSYIYKSYFKNDANMLFDANLNKRKLGNIYVYGISGLKIRGNVFENLDNTLDVYDRGTAITANNSSISVEPYCNPNITPCTNTKNQFNNLYYGVVVYGGIWKMNPIIINKNLFDDTYRAILISGTHNAEILLNDIKAANLTYAQSGQPNPGRPYGIYINKGTGFRVEENNIWRPSASGPALFNASRGIIAENTGENANQIYNNNFSNLFLGIQSQYENSGIDDDYNDVGLVLLCNNLQSSYYDFVALGKAEASSQTPNPNYARIGFALNQKISLPNPNGGQDLDYPAGNDFSNVNGRTGDYQFDNDDANPVIYSYDATSNASPNAEPTLISSNVYPDDIDLTNPCQSNTGGNGTALTTLYSNLTNAQLSLNTSKLILNIWKNGGNANLDEEVESTLPWEAYQQFNALIAMSPYLSEEVLLETVNNPVFTSLMIKLIMVANPQCTRSKKVMTALQERNPAMPQSYINEIKLGESTISQFEILKGNVSADNHLVRMIGEDIKRNYRKDDENIWATDSLIAFMSRQPNLVDKFELATIYYDLGQYSNMGSVFTDISNMDLDDVHMADYTNFVNIMNIASTAKQEGLLANFLSETQITNMETILNSKRANVSPLALAILKQNNPEFQFEEEVLDMTESSARLAHIPTEDVLAKSLSDYRIYPNPSKDYITLEYSPLDDSEITYSISNADGKVVLQKVLANTNTKSKTEVLIDIQGLSAGVYYFNLISNGKSLNTQKLVIIK